MRWIGWSLVLATFAGGLAYAQPRLAPPTPPAKRKPAMPTYQPIQLQLFAKAVIADKRGNLDGAEDEYQSVLRQGPALNAMWNLADVSRRRERWSDALKMLKEYIEAAETDADKQAAAALIKEIEATPYRLGISGDEPGGTIFIDGVKFATPAPVTVELDPGRHRVDWIGAQGYEDNTYNAREMGTDVARMAGRDPKGGNLILAMVGEMPISGEWQVKGATFKINARVTVPPGHYDIPVYDNRTCSNLVFDVPRDGLVYVFIKVVSSRNGGDCYPITVTSTKVNL